MAELMLWESQGPVKKKHSTNRRSSDVGRPTCLKIVHDCVHPYTE